MKALVYEAPYTMVLRDIEEPVLNGDDVKVRIHAAGICGSDLHGYMGKTGRRIPPMVMGHEFAGEIVETGPDVTRYKVGDRVTAEPKFFCGKCEMCKRGWMNLCTDAEFLGVFDKNGSMAEYVNVPERYVIKLPDNVSYEYGALIEPFAVGYHAVARAGDLAGKTVLIVGAGTIGMMVLINVLKKAAKAVVVSDLNEKRLELARSLGAFAVNAGSEDVGAALEALVGESQVDVTFEAVGASPTVDQAIRYLKNGGTSVWVGNTTPTVEAPMQSMVTRELTILGTMIYTFDELNEIAELLGKEEWPLDKMVSKKISMEETPAMMDKLCKDPEDLIKVLVMCGS